MNVDLKKLTHLVTVARAGSVSRAAEQLHLSQPALSRSISLVEEQLGAAVFERGASGVQLTSLGQVTVEAAEKLLLQARVFDSNVTLFSRGESGRVAFGVWPVISSLLLPSLSAHFMQERPSINMRATVKPAGELLQALYAGRIEWMLGGVGHFEQAPDLDVSVIGHIDVGLVVRAGHPLLDKQQITRRDLYDYPVLCGVELSDLPVEMADSGVFITDNFEVLKHTAQHSDGYWIAPMALVREDIDRGLFQRIDAVDAARPNKIPIAMIHLKDHILSPLTRDVADYARQFFAELG